MKALLDNDVDNGRRARLARLGILAEPLGYPDGANRYQWEMSQPTSSVDPTGLQDRGGHMGKGGPFAPGGGGHGPTSSPGSKGGPGGSQSGTSGSQGAGSQGASTQPCPISSDDLDRIFAQSLLKAIDDLHLNQLASLLSRLNDDKWSVREKARQELQGLSDIDLEHLYRLSNTTTSDSTINSEQTRRDLEMAKMTPAQLQARLRQVEQEAADTPKCNLADKIFRQQLADKLRKALEKAEERLRRQIEDMGRGIAVAGG
jgi:hypothetical protein